jgi:DNA polymerase V
MFISPALDYSEDNLDFEKIIRPRPSVFYFRAANDAMIGANIPAGSILVVDKAISPKNYSIVIATVESDFVVRYYGKEFNGVKLEAANPKFKTIQLSGEMHSKIWGVVIAVIILTNSI